MSFDYCICSVPGPLISCKDLDRSQRELQENVRKVAEGRPILKKLIKQYSVEEISFAGRGNCFDKTGKGYYGLESHAIKEKYKYRVRYSYKYGETFTWCFN